MTTKDDVLALAAAYDCLELAEELIKRRSTEFEAASEEYAEAEDLLRTRQSEVAALEAKLGVQPTVHPRSMPPVQWSDKEV